MSSEPAPGGQERAQLLVTTEIGQIQTQFDGPGHISVGPPEI
jgi:hypothetical protein